jgi:hypothetical protein
MRCGSPSSARILAALGDAVETEGGKNIKKARPHPDEFSDDVSNNAHGDTASKRGRCVHGFVPFSGVSVARGLQQICNRMANLNAT